MTFKHGADTAVLLDGKDLSAFLNNTDFGVDVDTAPTSTYGSRWKTSIAGQVGAKVPFTGLYDPALTDILATLGVSPASIVTYCPAGALAIGDRARLLKVATTAYGESSPVGGVIAFKWTVDASEAVGFGDVLHLLAADTNSTTGAEKDDGAASASGWTAHLHVIAVTGGSWVVKLQDAAVSNTYSDVTGGAFTAATGATFQRLQGAAVTTALRRYVRYVATRTGGTAGDSITFLLAYSRNQ